MKKRENGCQNVGNDFKLKYLQIESELVRPEDRILMLFGGININSKQGGTYRNAIRLLCQQLMTYFQISSRNVGGIFRSVLENIVHVKVDNVPQKSLACELLMEMRSLLQIQIANLLTESGNSTICIDGTTKCGHHYSSFDVCIGDDASVTSSIWSHSSIFGTVAHVTLTK